MKSGFLVVLIVLCSNFVHAQSDIVSWTGVQFNAQNDKGVNLTLRPIVRHNNDLSSYANTSLEFSIGKKLDNNLKASYLFRHWWMQDGVKRVFWWFDLSHSHSFSSNLSFGNRVRWHIAMDKDFKDPDFIRYYPELKYKLSNDLKVFGGVEFWFDLAPVDRLERKRFILGFDIGFSDRYALNFQYWLERTVRSEFTQELHTLVTTLKFYI